MLDWLGRFGLSRDEVIRLQPALPADMTSDNSYYVNSGIADKVFQGRDQGSLPITLGRWFLIPSDIVQAHPQLLESLHHPASASGPWPI
jgi:hypothetical protein